MDIKTYLQWKKHSDCDIHETEALRYRSFSMLRRDINEDTGEVEIIEIIYYYGYASIQAKLWFKDEHLTMSEINNKRHKCQMLVVYGHKCIAPWGGYLTEAIDEAFAEQSPGEAFLHKIPMSLATIIRIKDKDKTLELLWQAQHKLKILLPIFQIKKKARKLLELRYTEPLCHVMHQTDLDIALLIAHPINSNLNVRDIAMGVIQNAAGRHWYNNFKANRVKRRRRAYEVAPRVNYNKDIMQNISSYLGKMDLR